MTHPAATVFIAALLPLAAAMADPRQEARQTGQPIKPAGQANPPSEPRARPQAWPPELTPQRQLLEEMDHEKQLRQQQQPIRFGK